MERLNVAVLPAGSWGVAFSTVVVEGGHNARLFFHSEADYETFISSHMYPRRLPGVIFAENIEATDNFKKALDGVDVLVLAPPSRILRTFYKEIRSFTPYQAPILCLTKGLEQGTNLRMSQVLEEEEPGISQRLAMLSGPNLAPEIARGLPAATVVASSNYSLAERIQSIFSTKNFRIYAQDDILGVELGGAFKNVYAFASGVCDGLERGRNARAALIGRGLVEMRRLAVAMGAQEQTLMGLSGQTDLWLTCTSDESRNHFAGVEFVHGVHPKKLIESGKTIESFYTVRAMVNLAKQYHIEVPIAQAVYEVLYEGSTIEDAIGKLLDRSVVHENGSLLKSMF